MMKLKRNKLRTIKRPQTKKTYLIGEKTRQTCESGNPGQYVKTCELGYGPRLEKNRL